MLKRQQGNTESRSIGLYSIDQSSTLCEKIQLSSEELCHHMSPVEAFSRLLTWSAPVVPVVLANIVIIVENSTTHWVCTLAIQLAFVYRQSHTVKFRSYFNPDILLLAMLCEEGRMCVYVCLCVCFTLFFTFMKIYLLSMCLNGPEYCIYNKIVKMTHVLVKNFKLLFLNKLLFLQSHLA